MSTVVSELLLTGTDGTLLFGHKRLQIGAWIPELTCRQHKPPPNASISDLIITVCYKT